MTLFFPASRRNPFPHPCSFPLPQVAILLFVCDREGLTCLCYFLDFCLFLLFLKKAVGFLLICFLCHLSPFKH